MNKGLWIATGIVFGMSVVVVLGIAILSGVFQSSSNYFLRRYPPHPIVEKDTVDIRVDSYYVAGGTIHNAYLGNSTVPLHLMRIGLRRLGAEAIEVSINGIEHERFWSIKVKVDSPFVFLADGTLPKIYRGALAGGSAQELEVSKTFFLDYEPTSPNNIAIKYLGYPTKENMLGSLALNTDDILTKSGILEKQVDGVFCTDGSMCYDNTTGNFIYTYRYRNEFIVMDTSLNVKYRGRTIDTTSVAKIKVVPIGVNSTTFGSPPLIVNRTAVASNGLLFIQSNLLAENDARDALQAASIIDVYGVRDGKYRFSFYVPDYRGAKMRSFGVFGNTFVAVLGRHLQTFELSSNAFELH